MSTDAPLLGYVGHVAGGWQQVPLLLASAPQQPLARVVVRSVGGRCCFRSPHRKTAGLCLWPSRTLRRISASRRGAATDTSAQLVQNQANANAIRAHTVST